LSATISGQAVQSSGAMVISKSVALALCALNQAAYDLATTGYPTMPDGFTPPAAIRMPVGDWPFFLSHDPFDIWGYESSRDQKTYIVFRGTEITSDLDFAQEWAKMRSRFRCGRSAPGARTWECSSGPLPTL
jgi:hypothetical protein